MDRLSWWHTSAIGVRTKLVPNRLGGLMPDIATPDSSAKPLRTAPNRRPASRGVCATTALRHVADAAGDHRKRDGTWRNGPPAYAPRVHMGSSITAQARSRHVQRSPEAGLRRTDACAMQRAQCAPVRPRPGNEQRRRPVSWQGRGQLAPLRSDRPSHDDRRRDRTSATPRTRSSAGARAGRCLWRRGSRRRGDRLTSARPRTRSS